MRVSAQPITILLFKFSLHLVYLGFRCQKMSISQTITTSTGNSTITSTVLNETVTTTTTNGIGVNTITIQKQSTDEEEEDLIIDCIEDLDSPRKIENGNVNR